MERTIGALAKEAKVNLQTLRYYERRKLLPPARRQASGYRVYNEESLRRLQFIKRAQSLGFSLREIGELLGLEAPTPASCNKVMRQAAAKGDQIRQKVEALRWMENSLNELMADCRSHRKSGPCPIVECFSEGGKSCASVRK